MSGAVAQRANGTSKALGGKVSYAWATLAVFVALAEHGEVVVEVDGERREGRMHDVIVANGRYLGGGMMLAPEAEPDDGLFDVLLIGDVTKRDFVTDDAEDLPRHVPRRTRRPSSCAGRRRRSRPASRCRSSSTASRPGRRRRASRSCRAR